MLNVHCFMKYFCLQTLFNIVEDRFKKIVELWCSEGSINSHECKSFEIDAVTIKKSMIEYYHWINDLAHHLFEHSSGKWVHGESGHLSIFTVLKHLMMLLKYNVFRASFLHITRNNDSMYRAVLWSSQTRVTVTRAVFSDSEFWVCKSSHWNLYMTRLSRLDSNPKMRPNVSTRPKT